MLLSAPQSSGQPLWLVLAVAAVPALAAVVAAIVAGRYAKSSKTSEHEAQRLRDLESRISDRKYETYRPVIAMLGDMLNKDRAAELLAGQDIPARLHEFATWASIYASDDTVRAFRNLSQASFVGAPPEIFLRLYCEFVLAARRDIGRSDTTTTSEEILGMRITDLYAEDGLRWVVTEPFSEVCRRVGLVASVAVNVKFDRLAALPYAVDPPSGERAGSGAATTNGPGSITTNAGGPGDGLLGFAWVDGGREGRSPPGAGDPRRRHLGFKHLAAGAAGRRVRGGPEVQSATRRAGTVAPRLRGALIHQRQIRQLLRWKPCPPSADVRQSSAN